MEGKVLEAALALAGALPQQQEKLLEALCAGALAAVQSWVQGEAPEEALVGAASLLALAGLEESRCGIQEFRAGDLTVKPGTGAAGGLRRQAMLRLKPWLKAGFVFLGV